ncbi:MAG: amidohydrolase [Treponema sp.]|nr:amidohydrolase [Treponema sp.]
MASFITKAVHAEHDFIVDVRRQLHRSPELSGKEFETLKVIREKLESFSIPFVEVENGGIVAELTNKRESGAGRGRTLVLRAEIDALPITESENNLAGKRSVISQNPGLMHACGHDAHTAILLTASKLIWELRGRINGSVYAVFERGEEGLGLLKNILSYFEKEHIHPDGAHAIHVRPDLEAGKIAVLEGPVFACPAGFEAVIKGSGGHGSRPDTANSPLDCFTHFYLAFKSLRERRISPFEPVTTNIGKVRYGKLSNVIDPVIRFTGSARVYNEETALLFQEEVERLLKTITEAFYCTYKIKRFGGQVQPVINDGNMALTGRKAVREYIGGEHLIEKYEPMMCSDDFAFFRRVCPVLMVHLGAGNIKKGGGGDLHSASFDIDEDALELGTAETVGFALTFFADAASGKDELT